jgi:hypothetical protein
MDRSASRHIFDRNINRAAAASDLTTASGQISMESTM